MDIYVDLTRHSILSAQISDALCSIFRSIKECTGAQPQGTALCSLQENGNAVTPQYHAQHRVRVHPG